MYIYFLSKYMIAFTWADYKDTVLYWFLLFGEKISRSNRILKNLKHITDIYSAIHLTAPKYKKRNVKYSSTDKEVI